MHRRHIANDGHLSTKDITENCPLILKSQNSSGLVTGDSMAKEQSSMISKMVQGKECC